MEPKLGEGIYRHDIPVIPLRLLSEETSTVRLCSQGEITGRSLKEKVEPGILQSSLRVAVLNSDHTNLERIVFDEQTISSAELPNVCILQCINPRLIRVNVIVRWPAKTAGDSETEVEILSLLLHSDDTLSDIATAVMQQTTLRQNVHIYDQIFCYNGLRIRDEDQSKSLAVLNIAPNSTIEMMVFCFSSPEASQVLDTSRFRCF